MTSPSVPKQTPWPAAARLIVDAPAEGAWNMALDEALLATASSQETACLRFYRWSEPTLSLGYFQNHADRRVHPASRDCPVVRRSTGGGAILHDRELTYSFTCPVSDRLAKESRSLYAAFHETLVEVLRDWKVVTQLCRGFHRLPADEEPFLCFQRRADGDVLHASGDKIGGSAQRRRQGGMLQHGSVLLSCSASAPELPGIEQLGIISVDFGDLAEAWARAIGRRLGITWRGSEPTSAETQLAQELRDRRFTESAWTTRR